MKSYLNIICFTGASVRGTLVTLDDNDTVFLTCVSEKISMIEFPPTGGIAVFSAVLFARWTLCNSAPV